MSLWGTAAGLFRRFFSVPDGQRSALKVIVWWEIRRIPYNGIMFLSGFVGLMLLFLFDTLPPVNPEFEDMDFLGVIIFPIVANFAYTGGWIVELAAAAGKEQPSRRLGPALYVAGTAFTVLLTLLPAIFDGWRWLMRLLGT